jgi:maltodextrin utilization protein YvdJ
MNELLTTLYNNWRVVTLLQLALFLLLLDIALSFVTAKYSAPSSVDKEAKAEIHKMKDRANELMLANEELQLMLEQLRGEKQELVLKTMEALAQKDEEIEELQVKLQEKQVSVRNSCNTLDEIAAKMANLAKK